MPIMQTDHSATPPGTGARTGRIRHIGPVGTASRVVLGGFFLGSVLAGEVAHHREPAAWLLALVVFPALLLATQWLRARRFPARLRATGPAGHAVNCALFVALYATRWYAPPLAFISDAVLIFYGGSMLLAAIRGYAGCEVLAVSNWLLRRDDQVGCVIFSPLDCAERHRRHRSSTSALPGNTTS
jgi:hypothetical protein